MDFYVRFELYHHYHFPGIINTSQSNISWISTLIFLLKINEIKCLEAKGNAVHLFYNGDMELNTHVVHRRAALPLLEILAWIDALYVVNLKRTNIMHILSSIIITLFYDIM